MQDIKNDKGTAGLTIFLSLIVMLFVIGLLIMIFSIMSSELQDATWTEKTASVRNETITTLNDTVGDLLSASTLRNVVCTVTRVTNASGGAVVPTTNYTNTNCRLYGRSGFYLNTNVNVTYTYTYDSNNDATDVINDTSVALKGAVDFFDIFVVIGSMVVLILLTVVIITAIRSSGLITGQSNGTARVGTA